MNFVVFSVALCTVVLSPLKFDFHTGYDAFQANTI